MKIIVTGGCGFIGSNFIREILKKNDLKVMNIDSLTYAGNMDNVLDISSHKNYDFVKADISNKSAIEKVFNNFKPDIVINFAAETHVDRSISNPQIFVETNIIGTQNLIDLSMDFEISKFIQISTDEVYGDLDYDDSPFTEKTRIKPSSPYSASKASADMLVLAAHRTFGFPGIITRCSNNYGPFQYPEKLIPVVISCCLNNKKIPVYGEGKNIRDWINVLDHCSGIMKTIDKGEPGEVYNFGSDNEIENIKIIKKIMNILEAPVSLIEHVKDRPGHDFRYAINSEKARDKLGWNASIDFDSGLEATVIWYTKNKAWLSKVLS